MVTVQSWVQALDGIAVKPTEIDVARVEHVPVDSVVIDFEGHDAMPAPEILSRLARSTTVRVTIPVRGDGYDPLGDNHKLRTVPAQVDRVYVAGHPAYLSPAERQRAAASRLIAATDTSPSAWVGTEGVERIALATGVTQFELLGPQTPADVLALRGAGVDLPIAVYAPIVPRTDGDAILDAIGAYTARRPSVTVPSDHPTDKQVTGETRDRLLDAARKNAFVGDPETIQQRIEELHAVGVDHVIGYPATGVDDLQLS